jgi:hypothetical protein
MKKLHSKLLLASAMGLCSCLGFAGSAQAQIIFRPPVVVLPQPVIVAPQPVYIAPGPSVEYVATPFDPFIVNVAPADVVFFNGDTYIWAVDDHGHRYRRFYAHGDHRAEVFHRRDELHHVMERNGGRLPPRGEARHDAVRGEVRRDEHAEGRREEHVEAHGAAAAHHEGGRPEKRE